jgi:hypothetical protein
MTRQPWLLLALPLALALSCDGCSGKGTSVQHASPAPEKLEDFESFPVDERMLIRDGLEDSTNRYSSTVMVTASTPSGKVQCNGVIIAPRLVLTAGHCVCRRGKVTPSEDKVKTVIDSSGCEEDATVTTILYNPATEPLELVMGARYDKHGGNMPEHRLRPLVERFAQLVCDQPIFREDFGLISYRGDASYQLAHKRVG